MNDIREKMMEVLSEEGCFERAEEALQYAVYLQKRRDEDTAVFKDRDNNYYTIHLLNAEMAVQCGFTIVYGFNEIVYAAQSTKDAVCAIEEYRELLK